MVSIRCWWRPPPRAARAAAVVALAAVVATSLSACTSALSDLPASVGGLPAGAPERPVTPVAYPAVHDMPPPRDDTVLTTAEQKKAQQDLLAARDRQNQRSTPRPADDQ
jgi:hypothetical protein